MWEGPAGLKLQKAILAKVNMLCMLHALPLHVAYDAWRFMRKVWELSSHRQIDHER